MMLRTAIIIFAFLAHFSHIYSQSYDLGKAKKLAEALISKIYHRYEFHSQYKIFFLTSSNMGSNTWDIMKFKLMKKALDGNQRFLMIFGGSSVTAGHDHYRHQAYPAIVEKRMKPLLEALGINMTVRNIAQGANGCCPYDMCYDSMGGKDADFYNWEQSYNCGHSDDMWEMTARYAGYSKNKAVMYFSASGAWRPDNCPLSTHKVPYSDEDWEEKDDNITQWTPTYNDLMSWRTELNNFYKKSSAVVRFTGGWNGKGTYSGIAPHGFNVWQGNPLCEYIDKDGKKISGCNGIDIATKHKVAH